MEHDEFVEKTRGDEIVWGVRGFLRPVFYVWGTGGLAVVVAMSILVLTPALGFGVYCFSHHKYVAMAWALPAVLAFIAGKPNLNCIAGSVWVICALVGWVLSIFFGPYHLVGGLLPGLTWFLAGALRGTTMVSMGDRLRESPEAYRKLKESGLMSFRGASPMG
jgi:hypothetical protein